MILLVADYAPAQGSARLMQLAVCLSSACLSVAAAGAGWAGWSDSRDAGRRHDGGQVHHCGPTGAVGTGHTAVVAGSRRWPACQQSAGHTAAHQECRLMCRSNGGIEQDGKQFLQAPVGTWRLSTDRSGNSLLRVSLRCKLSCVKRLLMMIVTQLPQAVHAVL